MISFCDQIGRSIELKEPPRRIISLVPSQTELLFNLGLDEEVVGITKFCVHPQQWFKSKTRIGGTKSVKPALIKELRPDLIIANKEENTKEQVDALRDLAPVYTSNVSTLDGALIMIRQIGIITGKEPAAEKIIHIIREGFADLSPTSGHQKTRTAYLIWRNPYMSVGGDTFIHDMLTRCGFQNVFAGQTRYPETSIEELASKNTTLILLSSEPYPFRKQHIAEIRQSLPQASIELVDGEMFSWYGSRLQQTPAYFTSLLQKLAHHS
ncbi:helical backbone metal receptor [Asinibacterium sp. OR53]|uniref:helical backbone metal receptor n=1 Tax=Asinibacterium sp. OR53 TaxID=925409 RepID=UPI00047B414A|nr:helical backbone metal receptor [Asinibacterium sp. OR53]